MGRRRGLALGLSLACALAVPRLALAQGASTNAVTGAEDGFGYNVGNEKVGIYSQNEVRGFSPTTAGNTRLEGLYIDRVGFFNERIVDANTIRVGLAAQNYLFPAPTGIVDYKLGVPEGPWILSSMVSFAQSPSHRQQIDFKGPLTRTIGVGAGVGLNIEQFANGGSSENLSTGAIGLWRPSPRFEVIPFWSRTDYFDRDTIPSFQTSGSFVPEAIQRRRTRAPSWARGRYIAANYGVIERSRLSENWTTMAGLFRTNQFNRRNFANQFVDLRTDGTALWRIQAAPPSSTASTSGEFRVSRAIADGVRRHDIHLSIRGRDRRAVYGGSATINLGRVDVNTTGDVPQPTYAFGAQSHDHVRQASVGLAYQGRWRGVGSVNIGVQKVHYEKTVIRPGAAPTSTTDAPLLLNAAADYEASRRLSVFASYTRGLEETGVAPDSAANRTQALPAISTRQADFGFRYVLHPGLSLVVAGFNVEKPYFATDENNIYGERGQVRHRGVEVSFSGQLTKKLDVVAGGIFLRPRVSGPAVDQGKVGPKPISQTPYNLIVSGNYALDFIPRLALTFNVTAHGKRTVDRGNTVFTPSATSFDLGVRYRFKVGPVAAQFRGGVINITNSYDWKVAGADAYEMTPPRSIQAYLTVDL